MKTLAPKVMPIAGISIFQAEQAIGISQNEGYRKIKAGKLRAFKDSQGQFKVTEAEIYRYLREEV